MRLRGMTWSHPRGYDPLVAASREWRRKTGVEIEWDKRSLQDFESYPLETLAKTYDFMIIDHPHLGEATAADCLLPLDRPEYAQVCAALARGAVGPAWASYLWRGRIWALPIDVAAQVQAWRPDRIARPASSWSDALALARAGRALVPLRPPHSLLSLFTLCAHLGAPAGERGELLDEQTAAQAYAILEALAGAVPSRCFAMDPIETLEELAESDGEAACIPITYGYVSYAKPGFRARALRFADIPAENGRGPTGSTLGGAGLAVSARTAEPEAALEFAFWIAGAEAQRGLYAENGGQPGHAAAWEDEVVNTAAGNFYRDTRATLEGAWVRPRHAGYMAFQSEASARVNAALQERESFESLRGDLNALYRDSLGTAVRR